MTISCPFNINNCLTHCQNNPHQAGSFNNSVKKCRNRWYRHQFSSTIGSKTDRCETSQYKDRNQAPSTTTSAKIDGKYDLSTFAYRSSETEGAKMRIIHFLRYDNIRPLQHQQLRQPLPKLMGNMDDTKIAIKLLQPSTPSVKNCQNRWKT